MVLPWEGGAAVSAEAPMDDQDGKATAPGTVELQLRRVIELLPAAAYLCDATGTITFFNGRAARLWGRKPGTDVSEHFCGSHLLWRSDGQPMARTETPMALALLHG